MKDADGFVGLVIGLIIGAVIASGAFLDSQRDKKNERLADMYLQPPPGQMQGLDPNDLAVRQAWTSSVLRQSAMKVRQEIGLLKLADDAIVADPNMLRDTFIKIYQELGENECNTNQKSTL